jgi:hypothetical protein
MKNARIPATIIFLFGMIPSVMAQYNPVINKKMAAQFDFKCIHSHLVDKDGLYKHRQ